MKSLLETLQEYEFKKKRGDPLTDLIQEFQTEINRERSKPLPFVAVRQKIAHLNEESLRTFMSQCKDYKRRHGSFGKCFFGALKLK